LKIKIEFLEKNFSHIIISLILCLLKKLNEAKGEKSQKVEKRPIGKEVSPKE
jgi:hypothetical protein